MNSTFANLTFWLCLLAAMMVLPLPPAAALTLSDEAVICPLDGRLSTYRAVNSFSRFGTQLDLRPIGALLAPLPMPVCQDSGFVIYRDDFNDEEIARARHLVETPEYRMLRESETDYFIAAYQAGKLGEDPWTVAILTLKATWEVQEKPMKYDHYAALTVTRLDEAAKGYAPVGETGGQWWTARLLIVNFHRRLGEFEVAENLLAGLPYADDSGASGYRTIGERLADLIARKNSAAAEIAPREGQ